MTKIAVTGLTGVIGEILGKELPLATDVVDLFHQVKYSGPLKKITHVNFDLLNKAKIIPILKQIKPDVIIHMAAITHIDTCQKYKKAGRTDTVWKINVEGTHEIAKFCAQFKVHMIFLSTECVFDGKQLYYTENAKKNPINWYGVTKSEAENLILSSGAPAAIIRSVVAYHPNDSNKTIYGKILNELKTKKTIYAVDDQLFTPTYTYDIVHAIKKIMQQRLKGVYHIASSESLSPYDFCVMVAEKNNFSRTLVKKTTLQSFYDSHRAALRLKNACLSGQESNRILKFLPKIPRNVLIGPRLKINFPLVSIVIPTHNRKRMLLRLLKSLLTSQYKNIEIIIVDDASIDGTYETIKKKFNKNTKIRLFRNKQNFFAAESRNVGIKYARGDYIFFVDDDNVLDKNAIGELVRIFQNDATIGELGPVNYSYANKKKILWARTKRNMFTSKTNQSRSLKEFGNKNVWESDDVPNAYMVRSHILKKEGINFKKFYGIMYEESDLAYRIRQLGYTIFVIRKAKIYHDIEQSIKGKITKDYMYHFMEDKRRPYVFARNRIVFHSLYSSKLQLLLITAIWIWIFTAYYAYKILFYSGWGKFSLQQRIYLVFQYLRGNIAGFHFLLAKKTV